MQNGGWESEQVLHNVYQHTLSNRAEQENEKVINYFEAIAGKDKTPKMQHEMQHKEKSI